jgi:Pyridoxamine 5'-phosphate oxidase
MASWSDLEREAPEHAAVVLDRFTSHLHHILGTLRADGSPRVSGTELHVLEGEAWTGSMPDSWKGRDLRRDPRFALHAAPLDTKLTVGDAKIAGRAELTTDPAVTARIARLLGRPDGELGGDLFRLDLTEAVVTRVEGDRLHVATWRPGGGVHRVERA